MSAPDGPRFDLFVSYAHADDRDGWVTELVEVIKDIQATVEKAEPWRAVADPLSASAAALRSWARGGRTVAGRPAGEREAALAEALQAARSFKEGNRSGRLAALAPHLSRLPRPVLASLWTETLLILASHTRRQFLADLRAPAPVLPAITGPGASVALREIAAVIRDVVRCWP